jgi:hypothetical protein
VDSLYSAKEFVQTCVRRFVITVTVSLFVELIFQSNAGRQLNRMDRAVPETNHEGMIEGYVEQETTIDGF